MISRRSSYMASATAPHDCIITMAGNFDNFIHDVFGAWKSRGLILLEVGEANIELIPSLILKRYGTRSYILARKKNESCMRIFTNKAFHCWAKELGLSDNKLQCLFGVCINTSRAAYSKTFTPCNF